MHIIRTEKIKLIDILQNLPMNKNALNINKRSGTEEAYRAVFPEFHNVASFMVETFYQATFCQSGVNIVYNDCVGVRF